GRDRRARRCARRGRARRASGTDRGRCPPARRTSARSWRSPCRAALPRASDADVDECLIPQPLQPELALFLCLVGAQLPEALLLLQLVGRVVGAPVRDLDEMPAEARAERLADLADLELRALLLELGHDGAGADPAAVAAVGGGADVSRHRPRDRPEVVARQNLLADTEQPLLHGVVVHDL